MLKWNSDGWLLVEVGAGKWKMGVSIAKMPINAATHFFCDHQRCSFSILNMARFQKTFVVSSVAKGLARI